MITRDDLAYSKLYSDSKYYEHRNNYQATSENSSRLSLIKYTTYDGTTTINKDCCDFIVNRSKSHIIYIPLNKLPYKHQTTEFVKKWLTFINNLGFKVKYNSIVKSPHCIEGAHSITVNISNPKSESSQIGRDLLAEHSLVRYLWSLSYATVVENVLDLRDKPEFKHLDNWEIFQLVNNVTLPWEYHGLHTTMIRPIYKESTIANRRARINSKRIHGTYTYAPGTFIPPAIAHIQNNPSDMELLDTYKALAIGKKHVGKLVEFKDSSSNAKYNLSDDEFQEVVEHTGRIYTISDKWGDVVRININKFK